MRQQFLLDINICVHIIQQRPPGVRARFGAQPPGSLAVSAVTEAELIYGAYKSQRSEHNLDAVLAFVSLMAVLPFDSRVTDTYGRVRALLERAGTPIGPLDLQIAATGLAHGLPVVTNNVREFARVPGLQVENWAE
ncbi:MAG: type II toxin-antitoxin system tRNA(fMet)-specific endonuclease VapC [Deinococcus sp.]